MAQKPTVTFSKILNRDEELLLISFPHNIELRRYLKEFNGVNWSTVLKRFYVPYSKQQTHQLFQYLRAKNYYIDYSSLKNSAPMGVLKNPIKRVYIEHEISNDCLVSIHEFKKWMAQKRYSKNTMDTYESMLLLFFRFLHPKPIDEIDQKDLLRFNTDYIMANGYSYTYQNQAISAIKLFYGQLGNGKMVPQELERPKKSKRLPEVLSIAEVKLILNHTPNLKHLALLSLLYSCGLRIGEALQIELNDLDLERGFMHIKSGKGRKDRYVPIPKKMCSLLRRYMDSYLPKKKLFEGQAGGNYSPVSARQILKRSLCRAAIKKPVTLHTLRHSHATHLLENGTDIRYIQELLGHNSPKTTMIYTHVSSASLDKIKNPFDEFTV